ncbi:RNA polymerase sigma factor [Ornithinimicrobium flavum]|uniref:RNA polymerase sigma factor n=1 Tax=Ornithinimicrobium flavum TaxID=1288636 RepID=UPI0019310DE4|nr:sigma-70 family RNA polymerase sigma factor [Ornithinimicrobium flavum]
MSARPESSLEAAVQAQWSVIVASLLRTTGDWDLAEDCAQDATERALLTWPRDGVPDNPAAWLTSVARRRALDLLRRRSIESRALQAWTAMTEDTAPTFDAGGGYADDRLRLLFTCCHPDLSMRDRVALTLRSVCGLSTRDVAHLMLVSEPTMSQRLRRVRKQIVQQGLAMTVPPADQVQDRVAAVLAVIYLLFTEGYSVTDGTGLRDELAEEALTLAQLVTWLLPGHGEAHALRALVLLQHARRPTRTTPDGTLVPLDEQDRTRWDTALLAAGMESLRLAREAPDSTDGFVGVYRPQAGIVAWYDLLLDATASPVVAMNRAVAVGMRDVPHSGLVALEEAVDHHGLHDVPEVPAIRADLLRRAGDRAAAHEAYRAAHEVARTEAVRAYLRRRIAELS